MLSTSRQQSSEALCICICITGLSEKGDRRPTLDFGLRSCEVRLLELEGGKYEPDEVDGVVPSEYKEPASMDAVRDCERAIEE